MMLLICWYNRNVTFTNKRKTWGRISQLTFQLCCFCNIPRSVKHLLISSSCGISHQSVKMNECGSLVWRPINWSEAFVTRAESRKVNVKKHYVINYPMFKWRLGVFICPFEPLRVNCVVRKRLECWQESHFSVTLNCNYDHFKNHLQVRSRECVSVMLVQNRTSMYCTAFYLTFLSNP